MKTLLAGFLIVAAVGWTAPAHASIYYQGTVTDPGGSGTSAGSLVNSTILDGNTAGMFNSMNLSSAGMGNSLVTITVTLNVSGGNNSDLYAYLSYNGALVPLLNRIGVSSSNPYGSTGAGLNNVTLSDAASGNIHAAGNGALSGSYRADGQAVYPLSSASSFNANGGSITLNSTFGGMNPDGTWTLFFSDVVAGGGNETLLGWSLDITAVPEPITFALPVFGGLFLSAGLIRHLRSRRTNPAA
jgi:hypothetical protein